MDNLIDWFYGQVVGFLGNFFSVMGNMGVELFELDWVQAIVLFFSQLGWALFGVSLVVSGFEFGIEYSTGRGNLQQTALNAIKGFLAVSPLWNTILKSCSQPTALLIWAPDPAPTAAESSLTARPKSSKRHVRSRVPTSAVKEPSRIPPKNASTRPTRRWFCWALPSTTSKT